MPPLGPHTGASVGHDALRVWLDFWEITGSMRIDILRRTLSGGNPEKMITPDVTTITIPAVRAIPIGTDLNSATDRGGELELGNVKLELIDPVHEEDRLRIGLIEYEIDRIEERDLGSFAVWIVQARRIE